MREGAKSLNLSLRKEDDCLILREKKEKGRRLWEPLCLKRSHLGYVGHLLEY